MEVIRIGGNELTCDPAATRSAYRLFTPDLCDCAGCRNYRLARDQVFSGAALEFFGQFGIDPCKEAETYDLGPAPANPNLILYGGWFHFIGEIVKCGDRVSLGDNLVVWFSPGVALGPPSFAGRLLVQMEMEALVPWLLPQGLGIPQIGEQGRAACVAPALPFVRVPLLRRKASVRAVSSDSRYRRSKSSISGSWSLPQIPHCPRWCWGWRIGACSRH